MFRHCRLYFAVTLMVLAAAVAGAMEQGPLIMGDTGTISGRLLIEGQTPVPGGVAGFFHVDGGLPSFGNTRRVPELTAVVDAQGRFAARLPPGRYYLGVIVREDPEKTGPPASGERSYAAVDDKGGRRIFRIGGGAAMDIGAISVSVLEPAGEPAALFTVRGRVVHRNGHPFAGAWILVRRHPEAGRPTLIARQNDAEGRFALELPAGGPYYLIAKEIPGSGRPEIGRHVGAYAGTEPVLNQHKPEPRPLPLFGRAGETIADITILMIEVPDSELRQEEMRRAIEESGAGATGNALGPAPWPETPAQ